jgi:predicted NBD/HSP70 family sugar kinase
MVFAAGTTRSADASTFRGSNLKGVRAHNERLILSLVRQHEHLSKAEISRLTHLSAQTVSVIVRSLEVDGLLLRLAPQRGQVGQPSVPLRINPDGAYSLGLKIGRRSADLLFMDFAGAVRRSLHWTYRFPDPAALLEFLDRGVETITAELNDNQRQRIAGLGIATPYQLWNWNEDVGAPENIVASWRNTNLQAEIAARYAFPVVVANDGTAACGAELTFGIGRNQPDFIYLFVGSFVGGGVVLGRSLYPGTFGNAGALGSMLIPSSQGKRGKVSGGARQLIAAASLVRLEERLAAHGIDPSSIFESPDQWKPIGSALDDWIAATASALSHAIIASVSVIDFGAAIIDGAFPVEVRSRLVAETRRCVARLDQRGLSDFEVLEGSVGSNARAIGGASLPFFLKYFLNRDVLFKEQM